CAAADHRRGRAHDLGLGHPCGAAAGAVAGQGELRRRQLSALQRLRHHQRRGAAGGAVGAVQPHPDRARRAGSGHRPRHGADHRHQRAGGGDRGVRLRRLDRRDRRWGGRAGAGHRSGHGRQDHHRVVHRGGDRRPGQLPGRAARRAGAGADPRLRRSLPAADQPGAAVHRHGAGVAVAAARPVGQEGCRMNRNASAPSASVAAGAAARPSGWRLAVPLSLVLLLAVLAALPSFAPYFYIFVVTEILIMGLFAASFNLIFGYTGMLSFGHAAFFGMGAYTTAMLLLHVELPLVWALLASMATAALLALVIGFLSVRLSEVYFAMLTLAFGMMVYAVAHQWRSLTNGSDGITGFLLRDFGLGLDLQLADPAVYYRVVLAVVAIAAAVLYLITRSSFGLMLRAISENPERVAFCGIDVRRHRL